MLNSPFMLVTPAPLVSDPSESHLSQFVVEQPCPHTPPDLPPGFEMPFPIVVWVRIGEPVYGICPDLKWQVVPSVAADIYETLGLSKSPDNRYVCEHMGHLIE